MKVPKYPPKVMAPIIPIPKMSMYIPPAMMVRFFRSLGERIGSTALFSMRTKRTAQSANTPMSAKVVTLIHWNSFPPHSKSTMRAVRRAVSTTIPL